MKVWVVIAIFFAILVAFLSRPHWDDAELKAQCEAKGGTFVEARSPLHLCVKEIKNG